MTRSSPSLPLVVRTFCFTRMRPLSASNHGGSSPRSSPRTTSRLCAPVGSARATLQYHFPRAPPFVAREKVSERSGSSAHTFTFGVVRGPHFDPSVTAAGGPDHELPLVPAGKLPSWTR